MLEPFIQYDYNAFLHSADYFDGKPQRLRHIRSDYYGHTSELLAKAVNANHLDDALSKEDQEIMLESLRTLGALNKDLKYEKGASASAFRGFDVDPGGGLQPLAEDSTPIGLKEVLNSRLWSNMGIHNMYEFQQTMFQPVGGMGKIGEAFGKELGDVIRYHSQVMAVDQNDEGVTVHFEDTESGEKLTETADWCVCTIPLSILSQLDVKVGKSLKGAIDAVPYAPSVKVGGEFKRRFWEEDDSIFGGISYTDMPITQISYPSSNYFDKGPGVLLMAYMFGPDAVEISSMEPQERVKMAVELGSKIHPQYAEEFKSGISVAWHRVPWVLGCYGMWTESRRKEHYENLCAIDGRVVLAGEHASYINAWQEGAILSSLDAITRLHAHATKA